MTSRRLLIALLLLVAAPGFGEARTPTESPDLTPTESPDLLRWVKVQVDDSDEIVRRCDGWTTTEGTRLWFMVESLRSPSGILEEGRQLIWESHDLFVRVGVGPHRVSPFMVEGSGYVSHGPTLRRFHPTEDGSVLRVAWAVWGGSPANCSVEVNGSSVSPKSVSLARGRMLLASEMGGVGALDSSEASAAAVRASGWDADGYLVAWLSGTFAVQAPGEAYPRIRTQVSQKSTGPWQFTLLAKVHRGAMPALVILDLPS